MSNGTQLSKIMRRLGVLLFAGFFVGDILADDVLSRSQQVGQDMGAAMHGALHRMAMQQAMPWAIAEAIQQSAGVEPQEHVHLLVDAGRAIFSLRAVLKLSPNLTDRIDSEPLGVGTYHAFNADFSHVVRRDLGWSRLVLAGREWIVVVERDRPLERVTEEPLTGRWLGAYSYTGIQAGGQPVEKEAGPMSVLLLQEGDHCQWSAVSQRWNVLCSGIVAGTNLSAVADSSAENPTVILEAVYSPGEDKIRGTLYVAEGDEAGRATVFLQRAPE